jgi:hypothetical protein
VEERGVLPIEISFSLFVLIATGDHSSVSAVW